MSYLKFLYIKLLTLLYPDRGTCLRCGIPWLYNDSGCNYHITDYFECEGCFPLCNSCWGVLTPSERLPYYRNLWTIWKASGHPDSNGISWAVLWEAMKTAVLEGK